MRIEPDRIADGANPDFVDCDSCGGEFYRNDLVDGFCEDCVASLDAGDPDLVDF